jgi:hypothetical protein
MTYKTTFGRSGKRREDESPEHPTANDQRAQMAAAEPILCMSVQQTLEV